VNSSGRESKTVAAGPTGGGALGIRRGLSPDAIAQALIDNLHCHQAKPLQHATRNDWYMALAHTVRDRILERYITTLETITGSHSDAKVVAYLSAEYLTGPHLGNNLICLGIWGAAEWALSALGLELAPGDPRRPGDWVRPPIRIRYLRPGDPRRLAGGGDRQVAPPRQPVGDHAPGSHV
jgi:hypothetical protein